MNKCCDCGKLVWFWQRSPTAGSDIHVKCHQESLLRLVNSYYKNRGIILAELKEFNNTTRIDPKLKA